ncbi:MAG: RHS repeat-associated core domain-containing protein [Thermoguttaceae bacterium]
MRWQGCDGQKGTVPFSLIRKVGTVPLHADGPLYCGYFFDAETRLYLARNRYYNSSTATWINRDPIGYKGGMNLYEYVGDNPLSRTDPFGLRFVGKGMSCTPCIQPHRKCVHNAAAGYAACIAPLVTGGVLELSVCAAACKWAYAGSPFAVGACITACTTGFFMYNYLSLSVCDLALMEAQMKCGNQYNQCAFKERGCGCGPGNENWRPD